MKTDTITYRGYTIEPSTSRLPGYEYFPSDDGRNLDIDCTVDGFKFCGNIRYATTIDDAKDMIDETIMRQYPDWKVETFGPLPIGGSPQVNITKFLWLSDAVPFAVKHNGQLTINFINP